jgi:uncharacterized membrane protein YcaP (DUF421 family)
MRGRLIAYVAVVACLRIAGKRTLAHMDEYDLAVTVAVGSIIATTMLSQDVSLVQGIAAIAALIALQVAGTYAMSRWSLFQSLLESEPTLLFRDGRMLTAAMKKTRITEAEVLHAIRMEGYRALEQVHAVILETNGSFSVIPASRDQTATALRDVNGYGLRRAS